MAITPPARVPNSGNPGTFNEDADYIFGWFATFVSQFNAELPLISSKSWATYGGSANAINLTAGFVSLVAGMQVRFRATAANTGATTINLDGTGARPCRTIIGAVLPAGYIRTNTDTVATYDGTTWILERQTERGINANGNFIREASGVQKCVYGMTTATTGDVTWIFPATFSSTGISNLGITIGPIQAGQAIPSIEGLSLSALTFSTFSAANGTTRLVRTCRLVADGFWY